MSPIDFERAEFLAEMLRPQLLACGCIRSSDLTRAEPADDDLSVSDWTSSREIVFVVHRRQRAFRACFVLPHARAIAPSIGGERKGDNVVRGRGAAQIALTRCLAIRALY